MKSNIKYRIVEKGTIYNDKKTTNFYVERQGKFLFFNVWIECLTPMPSGEYMPVNYATFNEALKYICDRIHYKKLLFNSKTVNNVTVFSADLNTFDKDKFYEANKRDSNV